MLGVVDVGPLARLNCPTESCTPQTPPYFYFTCVNTFTNYNIYMYIPDCKLIFYGLMLCVFMDEKTAIPASRFCGYGPFIYWDFLDRANVFFVDRVNA